MIRRLRPLFGAYCLALACVLPAFGQASPGSPFTIRLWPDGAPVGSGAYEKANVLLIVHLPPPDKATGAALVICTGGAYAGRTTAPEGTNIARWLTENGIAGLVLEYRLPAGRPFVPLMDAQRALRVTRANASAWGIHGERIGIIGFFAGGYLASAAATHFDGQLFDERRVAADTPLRFIAHAVDDDVVSIKNSRSLYRALREKGVRSELLELPVGGHGLGLGFGGAWIAVLGSMAETEPRVAGGYDRRPRTLNAPFAHEEKNQC